MFNALSVSNWLAIASIVVAVVLALLALWQKRRGPKPELLLRRRSLHMDDSAGLGYRKVTMRPALYNHGGIAKNWRLTITRTDETQSRIGILGQGQRRMLQWQGRGDDVVPAKQSIDLPDVIEAEIYPGTRLTCRYELEAERMKTRVGTLEFTDTESWIHPPKGVDPVPDEQ